VPTVTYSNPVRCQGGGHVAVDVVVNGWSKRIVYTTDEIRAPLSEMPLEDREAAALAIIKLHFSGKTRAQMVTEFNAGPVTVTI
jgi:hypothetical protein